MADNKKKSCVVCRRRFTKHQRQVHERRLTPERISSMHRDERKRAVEVAERSADLAHLRNLFQDRYLDVAEFLVLNCFPVYEPETDRHGKSFPDQRVQHVTVEELRRRKGMEAVQCVLVASADPVPVSDNEHLYLSPVRAVAGPSTVRHGNSAACLQPEVPVPEGDKTEEDQDNIVKTEPLGTGGSESEHNQVAFSLSRSLEEGPSLEEQHTSAGCSAVPLPRGDSQGSCKQADLSLSRLLPEGCIEMETEMETESDDYSVGSGGEVGKSSPVCSLRYSPRAPLKVRGSSIENRGTVKPSVSECGKSGEYTPARSLRRSPRVTAEVLNSSNEAVQRPAKRRRILVLDSSSSSSSSGDSSSDSEGDQGMDSLEGRTRKHIESAYKQNNMYLTPAERDEAIKIQPCLRRLHQKLQAVRPHSVVNTVMRKKVINKMSVACKIIKFCAPDNDWRTFTCRHLTPNMLDILATILRDSIGLKSYSISNFLKVAKNLVETGLSHEECVSDLATLQILYKALDQLKKLSNYTSKEEAKKQTRKKMKDLYKPASAYEDQYVKVFETFSAEKHKCVPLFEKARQQKLSSQELLQVNNLFNFYILLLGNRPGIFTNMELNTFKKGNTHQLFREDGSSYYFFSTASNTTSTAHMAYIYMDQDIWDLLCIYTEFIRPKPSEKKYQNLLFLNHKGRAIYNASNDLTVYLTKAAPALGKFTMSKYRELLETLGGIHLNRQEQGVIHGMLTYSERHYLRGNDQVAPYKAGIPLLQSLLLKCSNGDKVESSLAGCEVLRESISEEGRFVFKGYCAEIPSTLPTAYSGTTAEPDTAAGVIPFTSSGALPRTSGHTPSTINSRITNKGFSDLEKLKTLVTLLPPIETEGPVPTTKELRELVICHPELKVDVNFTTRKCFNGLVHQRRMEIRTVEVVHHFSQMLEMSDLHQRLEDSLVERGWYTKKQFEMVKGRCKKAAMGIKQQAIRHR